MTEILFERGPFCEVSDNGEEMEEFLFRKMAEVAMEDWSCREDSFIFLNMGIQLLAVGWSKSTNKSVSLLTVDTNYYLGFENDVSWSGNPYDYVNRICLGEKELLKLFPIFFEVLGPLMSLAGGLSSVIETINSRNTALNYGHIAKEYSAV